MILETTEEDTTLVLSFFSPIVIIIIKSRSILSAVQHNFSSGDLQMLLKAHDINSALVTEETAAHSLAIFPVSH